MAATATGADTAAAPDARRRTLTTPLSFAARTVSLPCLREGRPPLLQVAADGTTPLFGTRYWHQYGGKSGVPRRNVSSETSRGTT